MMAVDTGVCVVHALAYRLFVLATASAIPQTLGYVSELTIINVLIFMSYQVATPV